MVKDSRWLTLGLLVCALVPGILGAQQAPDTADTVYLFKDLKPAPPLDVTTLSGQRVDLASLRGKVVLLNFWATWCGPCREEIPALEKLQRAYAGKIQVVGMSVDEIPAAQVAKVAARMGINYPVAMASPAIQDRFGGMPSIPVTWVIDPKGEVEQKNHGAFTYPVFETEVRAILGLPTTLQVARIDQLSPNGKVGTIDIPGIADALKALSPEKRAQALAALNSTACTCGCDWSLATCRVQDPSCGYSLPQALALIAKIKAEK